MERNKTLNLTSLAVIDAELKLTLQKAQEAWLAFDVDMSNGTQLKSMLQALGQVEGAFKITEMSGAGALVEDLLAAGRLLIEQENKRSSTAKATVSSALYILPKYVQLVLASGVENATLLVPIRNGVRSVAGLSRIPENFYSDYSANCDFIRTDYDDMAEFDEPAVVATGKRLRQMYQTGLIGVLRETDPAPHLMLMQRACVRLYGQIRAGAGADYWWLAAAVLEALSSAELELTYSRRRWLSTIDQALRHFMKNPSAAYATRASDAELIEMLYLLSLVAKPGPLCMAVAELVPLQNLEIESELVQSRRFLYRTDLALDADRVASISEQIALAKEILELTGSTHGCDITALQNLQDHVAAIAELLQDAGGNTVKERLQVQQLQLTEWIDSGETVDHDNLLASADLLLQIESILENKDKNALNSTQIDSMLNHSQLAGAELAVIKEAQAGINLAKRAITSYVESEFDPVHMGNVTVTLNSVRGGLAVLNLVRASSVAKRCIQFIESTLKKERSSDQSLLDTLADALISLEYYLSQVEVRKDSDEAVLDVADDSLAAIGYPA